MAEVAPVFLLLRFIGATGCTGPVGGNAISIEQNIPMWWACNLASITLLSNTFFKLKVNYEL